MNWWGKLLGGAFGFLIGGPLGALLGAAIGHNFDRGLSGVGAAVGDQARVQSAFFAATFSVMGRVAKADGRVSADEIAAARAVMAQMRLDADQERAAIALFREGKAADFPLLDVLAQLRQECHRRTDLLRVFVEIQLSAAYADGAIDASERSLLLQICDAVGLPRSEFEALEAMVRAQRGDATGRARARDTGPSLADCYRILGVDPDVDDAGLKRAYRRLMSQHHPDKLVAKGLPEEMLRVATERTREIRAAYERVRAARQGQAG